MDNPNIRKLLLTLIAVVAGLLGLLAIVLGLRFRPPRPDPARALYDRFLKKAALPPATGETPLAWLDRLESERPAARRDAERITDLYLRVRYSDDPGSIEALRDAVRRFPSARAA